MITSRFLSTFALGVLLWSALFFGFTLFIDPFGVSPFKVSVNRVNAVKIKRIHIDRVLKPYEVWRYQPKTLFLGTSRIHQSLDPSVLDQSRYEPAYNASIPASSIEQNVSYLRRYIELNPNLHTVVVELFFYNFITEAKDQISIDLLQDSLSLFASGDTLWASIQTLGYNLRGPGADIVGIKPGGYFYYPPGHKAKASFDSFSKEIWKLHVTRTEGSRLYEPAMKAVGTIIDLCSKHNIELIFVLTPSHAYDDYYIDATGAWGSVQAWLMQITAKSHAKFYSFSQPNLLVYEPVSDSMKYWYDPYHFTPQMGAAMLNAIKDSRGGNNLPDKFFLRLTQDNVADHVASRRAAIQEWALINPEFVELFEVEKSRFERRYR